MFFIDGDMASIDDIDREITLISKQLEDLKNLSLEIRSSARTQGTDVETGTNVTPILHRDRRDSGFVSHRASDVSYHGDVKPKSRLADGVRFQIDETQRSTENVSLGVID